MLLTSEMMLVYRLQGESIFLGIISNGRVESQQLAPKRVQDQIKNIKKGHCVFVYGSLRPDDDSG